MAGDDKGKGKESTGPEHDALLELEDMESLLEELEEGGWDADIHSPELPQGLQDRISDAGVRDITELKQKIARLHLEYDEIER